MEIYHRLGDAETEEALTVLLLELIDRFGPPPLETQFLYHLTRIKLFASTHQFTLLKMETYTLSTERQTGKETKRNVFPLPKTKKPDQLEHAVIALLKTIL
jgi:transcription-repair coupling factor (superfamily II helicase)